MKKLDRVERYWTDKLTETAVLVPGEEVFFPALLEAAGDSCSILEVGAGTGRMVKLLRNNGVTAEFHGIDLSSNVFKSGAIGVIGDARALPYEDGFFDLVYSLGVVEHFPETRLSIAEHARVTKTGGTVLVTTPHLCMFTPYRYLDYFLTDRGKGSFEEIRGRNLRLTTMKEYFAAADLNVTGYGLFGLFGIKRVLRKLKLPYPSRLQRTAPVGAYLYVMGVKR